MDAASPIVKFRALQKRYGDGPLVLDWPELDVAANDFISLIGPSGCGKSTVLKIVSGLSPASAGTVEVFGTTPRAARSRLAFIFQDATLLPWLTVQKNAELMLRLHGAPAQERTRRAAELLEWVGLTQAASYYPRQLSGGMKMRASIARALTLSPKLLLLDEPFGALDEMSRHRLNEELVALQARTPFAALFVTHSVAEAVFLSNRIFVLSAQPGRPAAEVRVDFSVPRNESLRDRPEFHAKVAEVRQHLLHLKEGAA